MTLEKYIKIYALKIFNKMLSVLHVASDKDNMIFDYIYSDSKESEQEKIGQPFCWVNQSTV